MRARICIGRDSHGEYDLERFACEVTFLDLLVSAKMVVGPIVITALTDSVESSFERVVVRCTGVSETEACCM